MIALCLALSLLNQDPALDEAPNRLAEGGFERVVRHVSPREADQAFSQIGWYTSVAEGAARGQALDQPLVMWLYFGDPRGGC